MGLLETCCCCCSLKTGTIIIGSLSIIYWIYNLCLIITTMVLFQVSNDQMDAKTDIGVDDYTYYFARLFDIKSFTTGLLSLCAVCFSIAVIINSILLIFGASKGRMGFLLPWIVSDSLVIVVYIVYIFDQVIKLPNDLTGGEVFRSILEELAWLALEMYLLVVVISHYQELKENRRTEGSNFALIYSAPSPRSQAQIIPNVPEKESA